MAEKGIIVADQETGESVAARDAAENDSDGNSRIVQLVDQATRKNTMAVASPLRTAESSDSFDMSTVPSGIANNALDIGDAAAVCVAVTYEDDGTGDGVYVTPIVLEASADNAIGVLEPKKFLGLNEDHSDAYASKFNLGTGDSNPIVLTPMQAWPVFGAERIGFHIWVGGGSSNVKLYACVCSDWSNGFTAINSADLGGQFGLGQD